MPLAALIHGHQQECGRDARFEEIEGSRGTIAAVAGRGRGSTVGAGHRTFVYSQVLRVAVVVRKGLPG
jgi:hypothetical protein